MHLKSRLALPAFVNGAEKYLKPLFNEIYLLCKEKDHCFSTLFNFCKASLFCFSFFFVFI